jgi:hypothetical protein
LEQAEVLAQEKPLEALVATRYLAQQHRLAVVVAELLIQKMAVLADLAVEVALVWVRQ